MLTDKVVVSWQGEAFELGRRLHLAACEHGLSRARQQLVVADGAPWIWNVAQDRWAGAEEVLDFIMPVSISGPWAKRCMVNEKRPALGWKRNCINYGTESRQRFWQRSPPSKGAVRAAKSFGGNKIILPNMPAA